MSTPEGWYPDTQVAGGERYWDGTAWTDQRRAKAVAPKATPAAGWYDDPKLVNTRRYWDGDKWTEHRQEKTQHAAVAPPVGSTSMWKRPLTFGGAIVVAFLAIWFLYGGGRELLWGGETPSPTDMAADIESGLSDQGLKDAILVCSGYPDQVDAGDTTICEGTTTDGTKVSVLVTFNSDGGYVWQQQ
jgi:hypothetical protein